MGKQPTRPILRYHGGKWMIAPWILSFFPEHKIYVEPYAGAASVLLRKPRAHVEVINDLDGEIVNLFRVLRDPDRSHELIRLLRLTPFSREEFESAFEPAEDLVERARRQVVKAFMGLSTESATLTKPKGFMNTIKYLPVSTGFRNNKGSEDRGCTPSMDFAHYPEALLATTDRLRGVCIEHKSAVELIQQFDAPHTLFYCDPPYVRSTRYLKTEAESRQSYRHEMTDDDHKELAEALRQTKGMVVLSGYACELYEELYGDWHRVERRALADGGRERVEVLWINEATWDGRAGGRLF